ncbi:MAG: ABC transporter substrate-binding protein [Eubacteriales bacterium]
MKQQGKNIMWKRIAIIIGIIIVFLVYVILRFDLMPHDKDYIDGNVLNVTYRTTWEGPNVIVSPWVNMDFNTMIMYRTLFLADATFTEIENDLAEDYLILDDGLTYSITLKDDVIWSDGTPLTVEDIRFSLEAILLADVSNAIYTTAFLNIEGVEEYLENPSVGISGVETSEDTIIIRLDNAYPSMLQVLAQFVILPEHVLAEEDLEHLYENEYWNYPVVSGMYKVGEIDTGNTITFVKNEYYVGQEPNIDTVVLHVDIQTTELDFISTTSITDMINYQAMRGRTEYPIDLLFYRYFVFNMEGIDGSENEAMQDVRVRQAIAYAINQEDILDDVYLNAGSLIDSGVPRYYDTYNGVEMTYDPEKAKELLAEAEYDFDRELRIAYYYPDDTTQYFLDRVMSDLEAVGFTVVAEFATNGTTELFDTRDYDIGLKGLSAFQISEWYDEYLATEVKFNMIFPTDSEFHDIVVDYNSATDESQSNALLGLLQELEAEYMYKLPLFTLGGAVFINEDRVEVPDDIVFANPYYRYDMQFEEWEIKKD